MAKLLEMTISGSYHDSKKEICDFEGVKVVLPATAENIAEMHMQSRYALRAIRADKRYQGKSISKTRQTFVDEIKEVEGNLSFVGKDIKLMTEEELQDLAVAKDLRGIPLPKAQSGLSLREMRVIAYAEYVEKVLGGAPVKWRDEGFNFATVPAVIVDGGARTEKAGKVSNEDIIAAEQRSTSTADDPRTRFTLPELKKLADEKQIPYHPSIGFDTLYAKLYG